MNITELPRYHILPQIEAYGEQLFIGKNFMANSGCHIKTEKTGCIVIGNNVFMNHNCVITAMGTVKIGDGVKIGPNVMIFDHDHDFRCRNGMSSNCYQVSNIIIGNNCWIGAGAIILRGSSIGDNCVIGAGAIVKGIIKENTLVYDKCKLIKESINYEE